MRPESLFETGFLHPRLHSPFPFLLVEANLKTERKLKTAFFIWTFNPDHKFYCLFPIQNSLFQFMLPRVPGRNNLNYYIWQVTCFSRVSENQIFNKVCIYIYIERLWHSERRRKRGEMFVFSKNHSALTLHAPCCKDDFYFIPLNSQ